MSNFLRFENGAVILNAKTLMISSAQLSITPNLQENRVYGSFDEKIMGAKTEFVGHQAVSNLKGKLDISFYISPDVFGLNGIDRLFELASVGVNGGSDYNFLGEPIHANRVGRYTFDDMYLNSISFSVKPFSLIAAQASYDIYGTIRKQDELSFIKSGIDFAHSLKSFGNITVAGIDRFDEVRISSMNYNITAQREIANSIVSNEQSLDNLSKGGPLPSRVNTKAIFIESNIKSNEMIEGLNCYGSQQVDGDIYSQGSSSVNVFLYDINGNKINSFICDGKIISQSNNLSEGSVASSDITIRQTVR